MPFRFMLSVKSFVFAALHWFFVSTFGAIVCACLR